MPKPVCPSHVEAADLGYEWFRTRWMAMDRGQPLAKRRVARAMHKEINRAAERRSLKAHELASRSLQEVENENLKRARDPRGSPNGRDQTGPQGTGASEESESTARRSWAEADCRW